MTAQRLAGVRWALNTDRLKTIKRKSPFEFPQGHGFWVAVPETMPRVRMLTDAQVSDSITDDIEQIDIEQTALLDQSIDIEPGEPGTASIVTEPGELRPARMADRCATTGAADMQSSKKVISGVPE